MSKVWKNSITAIYGLGVIIVFVLLAFIVAQSQIVVFPDAMLQMGLHELASVWLMAGFLPMLIFSVLFYKVHDISKSSHKIRNTILVYFPAAICLVCVLFWVCVWGIGIANMVQHMTG